MDRILLFLWMLVLVLIAIGELLPGDSRAIEKLADLNISDALLHFGAYGLAALLPCLGIRIAIVAICLAITVCVGILLEFGQAFIPGRSCDIRDVFFNSAGVIVGGAIGGVVRQRFKGK